MGSGGRTAEEDFGARRLEFTDDWVVNEVVNDDWVVNEVVNDDGL